MQRPRPEDGVSFAVIPRHPDATDDHFGADQRVDPYWSMLWNNNAKADFNSWKNLQVTAAHSRESRMWERDRRMTPENARTRLLDTRHRLFERVLACASVPASYGVATNQQIAAFLGAPEIARHAADLNLLFTAGLLERGWPKQSGLNRKNSRCPIDLYRPVNGRAVEQVFGPLFRQAVQVGITADNRWPAGSKHPRHDVLATELALRVAECCWQDVTLVLGETEARLRDIATPHEDLDDEIGERTADLVLHRQDFMPVAVELTGNVTKDSFRPKVEGWAQMLAARAREDDGCAVIFLEAGFPIASNSVASQAREYIRSVVTRHGDSLWGAKVSDRMLFARWSNWFPDERQVDPTRFTQLHVERVDTSGRWHELDALDPTQLRFEPSDDFYLELGARWAKRHLTWAIPYWLRDDALAADNVTPIAWQRMQARSIDEAARAKQAALRRNATRVRQWPRDR